MSHPGPVIKLKISVRTTGYIFNRFFKDYYIFNLDYEKRKILSKFIICGQGLGVIKRSILDSKKYWWLVSFLSSLTSK